MRRRDLRQLLSERILVSDGAMGTLLQSKGTLQPGGCPDLLNLLQPDLVQWVHQQYLTAGCDLIQTNTFGANQLKLADFGLQSSAMEINRLGAQLARQAASAGELVAGNIGPTGRLIDPLGPLLFDQACEAFYQQAKQLAAGEVDLILIETMSDLHEAKAAVIGAKAACGNLPIICSVTYTEDLRTLTGADPETVVTVLEALGVDVVGVNCGFGPDRMAQILLRQFEISDCLLSVQPNAGLPHWQGGRTIFSLSPDDLAGYAAGLISAGANLIGGCCGTTPEHLRLIVNQARLYQPRPRVTPTCSKLAGVTETIYISDHLPTQVIGERINPTARKKLSQALQAGDFSVVAEEAVTQVQAGATMIDVNVSIHLPGVNEAELMEQAVRTVQRVVNLPLSLDTTSPQTMQTALKVYRGKPLLNSTSGDEESLERVTDLAGKFGAAILGLTLDSRGIPASAEERLAIARRIVERALAKGIRRADIYIDGLTLTAGASQELVLETIKTIRLVKEQLGVRTALGISNVSHGLPNRASLNNAFLAAALAAGLDLPIINPAQADVWSVIRAQDVITNRDRHAVRYLADSAAQPVSQMTEPANSLDHPAEQLLLSDILAGDRSRLQSLTDALLKLGWPALRIIDDCVISAMEQASKKYDQRVFFLPQLLLAAEAAQATFQLLRNELEQTALEQAGTIILATVKGDIHDIGKSIVGLLLRNHGFRVVDLGRNVDSDLIVRRAREEQADLIALSSLMTTTMSEMAVVVQKTREQDLHTPIMVGGAVVSADFAKSIGADYAADATEAVRLARQLISKGGSGRCKGCGNA